MRTRFCRALLASLLLILLIAPPPMWAWGGTGHEAVAYVAWQKMTPATRRRATALLMLVPTLHNSDGTKSISGYAEWVKDLKPGLSKSKQQMYLFMRAATWADTIKHEWLKDSDTPPPDITEDVNLGYTDTASHGYWHFVDNGFASDASTVPDTPVPNAATQIVALRADIASDEDDLLKSYDLVWLEHLVGDIHQPLHGAVRYFDAKGDQGGNLVKVKLPTAMKKAFEGTQSTSAPSELHAFWDNLPGEGQPWNVLDQAVIYAQALPTAPATKVKDIDPADWTADSFALAKKDVYKSPIGAGLQPPAEVTPPATSYLVTTVYYTRAKKDAQRQIALAGARLAKLLNENLK
jgi:hypothetical protein